MNRMQTRFSFSLAHIALGLLVLLSLSALASAASITPGAVLFPAPGEAEPVGGTVLYTAIDTYIAPSFTGKLTSEVVAGDTSNPLTGLTFTYKIENLVLSVDDIVRLSVPGYSGIGTDASYSAPTVAIPPTFISRSASGSVMGFNFVLPAIPAGASSALLVVQTDAKYYVPVTASLIDGSTATALSVAPSLVPEPSSVVLAVVGLLGLAGGRLFRRRG